MKLEAARNTLLGGIKWNDAVWNPSYQTFPLYKAQEADMMRTVNVDDENMLITLITDKLIEDNGLIVIDNPIFFEKGNAPTSGGLFSNEIFGTTPNERKKTHACIDLKRKFIHPYVYEVIKKVFTKLDHLCAGESSWGIDEDGKLEEIKDQDDKRYNPENTGLQWFIDNYHKITFKETGSGARDDRLTFLEGLTDAEMFVSKWVVIPVFYREADISSGNMSIPEINDEYRKLIQLANTLGQETNGFYNNKAMFRIENTLVNIRKYGQSLIAKKKGAFQQSVLGKSIDYGSRSVISVPSLNGCDTPDDCIVDILHTGIPVAKCCEIGFPFMSKWVLEFFEKEFEGKKKMTVYRKNKETGEYTQDTIEIKDQMEIFTKEYIDKKMKWFIHHFGGRFEPIKIKCKDGTEANMLFTGRGYSRDINNPKASTIATRPMTWTDIFYLAAMETLTDKYVYTTRYPLIDYFGTFPSQLAVLSTIKTAPAIINGKVYLHYPVIDSSLSEAEVTASFIDTVSMSNLYLKEIGGDYDGDMVSIKLLYSIEANQEAAEMIHDIKHYVSVQGKMIRVLSNEASLMMYNLTRH